MVNKVKLWLMYHIVYIVLNYYDLIDINMNLFDYGEPIVITLWETGFMYLSFMVVNGPVLSPLI